MKYDICLIAESMFWWFPVILDLDTGKTYTIHSALAAAEVDQLKAIQRIPHYSEAPVYQKYLEVASNMGVIDTGTLFERYPIFEFTPFPDPEPVGAHYCDSAEVVAFYKEAANLCDAMPVHSGILDLSDFLEEYEIQFAKEWCKQAGLKWYDRRPAEARHALPADIVRQHLDISKHGMDVQ